MKQRILLVDDETHVLSAISRQLGDLYDLTLAVGPFEGLEAVERGPEYAVVMADMRMPGMDGIQFLAKVSEACPNTIRMMLTGNADHLTAVQAVNEGNVFRFLNKPADKLTLTKAIDDSLAQYRLLQAEKELLEKTLSGSIKVLVEILATVNPALFGKAQTLKANAAKLAIALNAPDVWQIELAAMLCQIGSVALPPAPSHRDRLRALSLGLESQPLERIPQIGSSLINKIPRLEAISESILYQDQHFDGTGFPGDGRSGDKLPLAARILKVLKDFDTLCEDGKSASSALDVLCTRAGWYDPEVILVAIEAFDGQARPRNSLQVKVADLTAGDTLCSDLFTKKGLLMASAGQVLSEVGLARICTYVAMGLLDSTGVVYVVGSIPDAA